MKIGYADPPYIGQARKLYKCAEIDHAELIARLERDFPDGWALSASSTTLKTILAMCRDGVRVSPWVKPFCSYKPGINPAYAWEPVIWRGGRQPRARTETTVRDWVSANITLERGLTGAKPEAFCFWLFDLLGLRVGDDFADLFPGSGAVSRAWLKWTAQQSLPLEVSG